MNKIEYTLSKMGYKMKTLKEKYEYNKTLSTPFSYGYVLGVQDYRKYPKETPKGKCGISANISYNKQIAATGDKTKPKVQFCRGYICGVRDSANERKQRR